MPPPLLLVHDDLATIASVRKALTRAGHSVHLATSTADALTAFEHLAPAAVLLAPAVEGGRGVRLLAELRTRPAGAVTPVLLLGAAVPGAGLPVLTLPVDPVALLHAVESALSIPEPDDLPLLDPGHMEELPPLVDAALAQAEADLEAEAFAGWHNPEELPSLEADAGPAAFSPMDAGPRGTAAEAQTHAAREEAEEARARATVAESARAEAEEARASAEAALRAYQRAEGEERARRTEAEARARAEADEARRLEAEARAAQAQVEEARARAEEAEADARAAHAQGTAEAELLAAALREEASRRTRELAAQERLRAEAEARAEREARAREDAEARAAEEVARLEVEVRRREEEARRARAEEEARAAEEAVRLAAEVREREEMVRRTRAEADDWAAREREALSQAERAREQAQALEVEAAHLAERLAQGERAALEALARAEDALRRERATGEALRSELAAARAASVQASAAPSPDAVAFATPPTPPPVRRQAPRPSRPAPPPSAAASSSPGWSGEGAAARLEWGAADGGRVTLEQLAALVLRLEEVRATARLELRAEETLRMLWLADGALVGAASTHPAESLVQRAVGDGLLDEATAAEARALRLPDEALAAELVERGALRDAEVVPLLQRCTEARALEALSERDTAYRLVADATPPADGCAPARPLAAVLAEALRRALPPEEVEARTRGPRATPRPLRRVELGRFEFGERERRLLDAVDGERTVLELLTRTGIRQDAGLRALAVAEVLGLLDIPVPDAPAVPEAAAEVELERLEAKWAAAEEADYFTVLGVPRTAGTEEVQRAHARLAAEFDPLRYAGHPDPDVPARAARLQTLLDEAAQALTDERLRVAYARSLVDGEGGSRAT